MKRRTIAIAVVVTLVTLIVAEVAMRISFFIPVSLPSSPYISDDEIGFRLRPTASTDADGFNNVTSTGGDPSPARHPAPGTVVFVGDSFTFGTYQAELVFPALVAANLAAEGVSVRAVNLGIPSAGPDAYVRVLKSYLPRLRPMAAVVTIYLGNDVTQADPERPTKFWLGQLIGSLNPFSLDPGDLLIGRMFHRLWALAKELWYSRYARSLEPDPAEAGSIVRPFSEEAMKRVRWSELDAARVRPGTSTVLSYEGLARQLGQMAAVARANNTKLLVVLAPARVAIDADLQAQVIAAYDGDPKDFDGTLPERRVADALAARGIAFVDLTPPLAAAGPARVYNRGDTHWNRRGNAIAAEAIAEALKPMLATP